jgi:hypothetical protein
MQVVEKLARKLEFLADKYQISLVDYVIMAVFFLFVVLLIDAIIHYKPKARYNPQMQLNFDEYELHYEVMPKQRR